MEPPGLYRYGLSAHCARRDPPEVMNRGASASDDVTARFGRRLRELRRAHDLTQVSMAVHFGIDRSFISDVERGRKSISLPMLEVIALGLEISLSELLYGV